MIGLTLALTFWKGFTSLLVLLILGWVLYRWMLRSDSEPGWLLAQWIMTGLVLAFIGYVLGPMLNENPFIGVPLVAACGLVLAIIWRSNLLNAVAKPFINLYTGGEQAADPTALYSIAEAKRKRGHYQEAIAEIEKELAEFPTDFQGHLMLAEIQAENLHDVPAAQATIERLLRQESHAPKNIAFALNRLADWQLNLSHNAEAARQALTTITQLFPDTEFAYHASQRIAHLNVHRVQEQKETRRVVLPHHPENLGLRSDFDGIKAPPENIEAKVAGYIQQLEQYPADNEAREQLALLYAHHYQRLDLAVEQLEQLIGQAGVPARQIVRWLNLMADLHIAVAQDIAAARQTLTRITELFPNSPDAEKATSRMNYLSMELKGRQKARSVALGAYDNPFRIR